MSALEYKITLSFFDIALDVKQDISKRLDDYLRLELIPQCQNLAFDEERFADDSTGRIRIPRPNYPPRPQLNVNEIYWPTGATRWAEGFFLLQTKDAGFALPFTGQETQLADRAPVQVIVTQNGEDVETIEFAMRALEAREISNYGSGSLLPAGSGEESDPGLWLIHLVDERYFLQFTSVDYSAIDENTTWTNLYTQITTDTGFSFGGTPTVQTAYLKPDYRSLNRNKVNAAIALDAIAHSVGQRITLDYVKPVSSNVPLLLRMQDNSNYDDQVGEEDNKKWKPSRAVLGGPDLYPPIMPKRVRVAFRRANNGIPACGANDLHEVEYDVEDTTVGGEIFPYVDNVNIKHHIFSTQWAKFANAGASVPTNDTELNALALRITEDYYNKFVSRIDQTIAGIVQWEQCAGDDFVLYSFGVEGTGNQSVLQSPDGSVSLGTQYPRMATTRVCSMAPNFCARHQLTNDAAGVLNVKAGSVLVCTTTSPITVATAAGPGSGTANVYELKDDGTYNTTPVVNGITIYNTTGDQVAASQNGVIAVVNENCIPVVVVDPCTNPPVPA